MKIIAGVDEAGRGPWAGPVVAAAVILSNQTPPRPLRDSKKCSFNKRLVLYQWLVHEGGAQAYAIRAASVRHISHCNIRQASLDAMTKCVMALSLHPHCVLIDGIDTLPLPYDNRAIIGGDDSEPAIAAASILAKVMRDHLMVRLAKRYQHYDWDLNKGYGTSDHKKALQRYGATPHHRMTFKPLRRLSLEQGQSQHHG